MIGQSVGWVGGFSSMENFSDFQCYIYAARRHFGWVWKSPKIDWRNMDAPYIKIKVF